MKAARTRITALPKINSGVRGLDEITNGGLPLGRTTLVCGAAGCGKTLLAMEFLVRGARDYNEPGVFMAFEETARDLSGNVASLGFDLEALVKQNKIVIDHVFVERSEIEETGEYDLEGLFIRLQHAIDRIGAKRVVLDTIEALFGGLPNPMILRAELRRLFRWLKDKGVTAIVTGERGESTLTRFGIEEYVSDCVIVLDHRVSDQISTRRVRIAKYRGTSHGTNEYPFLIDETGISILPITSMSLRHSVSNTRVSSGVPRLDAMLGGSGYFRGSSVLVSGTAGSGKTSVAACFADAACRRGERALYFAFEESPDQILRNMRSIGLDLGRHVTKGLLQMHAARPSLTGLEMHLARMLKAITTFEPHVVVIDPISAFLSSGNEIEVKAMLMRLVDFLKARGTTALLVSLASNTTATPSTESEISSLIDTWLLLRDLEQDGERNRTMYVLKSRGMAHSNQVREFILTSHGVQLVDVYIGPEGVLTGAARQKQAMREKNEAIVAREETERKRNDVDRKRLTLGNQIIALQGELASLDADSRATERQRRELLTRAQTDRDAMGRLRHADVSSARLQVARKRGQGQRNGSEKEKSSIVEGNGSKRRLASAPVRRRSDTEVDRRVR